MSRLTQARRWASKHKLRKLAAMTEGDITPEEARAAVTAVLQQVGCMLVRVNEYDMKLDRFRCTCQRISDGKYIDSTIPGETVARVVLASRIIARTGGTETKRKPLVRPSDAST
jgi:hypothetical protein